jgi:hypothetical protein
MTNEELKTLIRQKTLRRESTDLFKYVLCESERYNKSIESVVTKLIKDNESNFELTQDNKFLEENKELSTLLPLYATLDEIKSVLLPLNLDNSGKSMGIAIKELKSKGLSFRNEDIKKVLS